MRCMELANIHAFNILNAGTAIISLTTSLYLLPLIPSLMSSLDEGLESLKHLNEELESSKRKLMTFMAFLCHEIRNPLFVITSNIAFLEDEHENHNAEQDQAVRAISESVDLMLRLVNDVLDISKLESGRLELQEHDFDLRDTLEGVIRSSERFVMQKHGSSVTFNTHIADNVPRTVHGDSVRLLQIVFNLLSNANKFTEAGSINFSVSVVEANNETMTEHDLNTLATIDSSTSSAIAETDENVRLVTKNNNSTNTEDGDFSMHLLDAVEHGCETTGLCLDPLRRRVILRIRVEDTGSGIPQEHMERLFKPYSQSKLSSYRKHGGTGLGLAIISKLAFAMGGKVAVRSEIGKGSVFDAFVAVHLAPDVHPSDDPPNTAISNSPPEPPSTNLFHPVTMPEIHIQETVESPTSKNAIAFGPGAATNVEPPRLSSRSTTKGRRSSGARPNRSFPSGLSHVLVVDDNDMNRKLLKRMLKQMNLPHLEARHGREAVEVMLKTRNRTGLVEDPQVGMVLMDLSMPVMDGFEATESIRTYSEFEKLPIIALTAAAVEEGREKCREVGMTEYQTKPIKRDQLYTVCQRYLLDEENVSSIDSQGPRSIDDLLV